MIYIYVLVPTPGNVGPGVVNNVIVKVSNFEQNKRIVFEAGIEDTILR